MVDEKKEQFKKQGSLTEQFANQTTEERFESLIEYAKANVIDTIVFVILALSILWLFFNSFTAGIVIGVIFGIYFSCDILPCVRDVRQFVDNEGIARAVVLAGSLLALFIALPGFFIGAAIAIAIKELYARGSKKPKDPTDT